MLYLGTKYPAFDPDRLDNQWITEDPPELDCGNEDLEEFPLEKPKQLTAYERWLLSRKDPE